jgi:hypothetical protein
MPAAGQLFLGINDAGVDDSGCDDNHGELRVEISRSVQRRRR